LNLSAPYFQSVLRETVAAQDEEERRRWKAFQLGAGGTPNEFMRVTLRDGTEISGVVPIIYDDQIVFKLATGERRVDRKSIQRATRIVPGNGSRNSSIAGLVGFAVATPLTYSLLAEDPPSFTQTERLKIGLIVGVAIGGIAAAAMWFTGNANRSIVAYEAP
jgi:hypothetical protein